jgi:Holliday junction resolvase RusA-like endonuclease
MIVVDFHVLGLPAPQGSKTRMPNGAVIEGKSAVQRERHGNWRSAVAEAAKNAVSTHNLAAALNGPLHLTVRFRFPMPAGRAKRVHEYGSAWKTSAPDLDKILRATGDALTAGGLIVDDARICQITVSKIETVGWTGAEIHLETIDEQPA